MCIFVNSIEESGEWSLELTDVAEQVLYLCECIKFDRIELFFRV